MLEDGEETRASVYRVFNRLNRPPSGMWAVEVGGDHWKGAYFASKDAAMDFAMRDYVYGRMRKVHLFSCADDMRFLAP